MKALIEVAKSMYLTGDTEIDVFVEEYIEIKIFGVSIFKQVKQSTDEELISKYCKTKRKPIGF